MVQKVKHNLAELTAAEATPLKRGQVTADVGFGNAKDGTIPRGRMKEGAFDEQVPEQLEGLRGEPCRVPEEPVDASAGPGARGGKMASCDDGYLTADL